MSWGCPVAPRALRCGGRGSWPYLAPGPIWHPTLRDTRGQRKYRAPCLWCRVGGSPPGSGEGACEMPRCCRGLGLRGQRGQRWHPGPDCSSSQRGPALGAPHGAQRPRPQACSPGSSHSSPGQEQRDGRWAVPREPTCPGRDPAALPWDVPWGAGRPRVTWVRWARWRAGHGRAAHRRGPGVASLGPL